MKSLLLFLCPMLAFSQVTLRVTSIPSSTPVGSSIYMAGTINNWNPGSAAHILTPDGQGNYLITIPEGTGTVSYKFTRGSWGTVEGNATGGYLPDRTFTFTGLPQIINLTIQTWEDLGSGTAAANVSILSNNFEIPQLNTTRRIWLYLPPDYATTTKHYPVLYMQDGQNLFNAQTSFSGEWQVDETLNELFANGDYGAIVVGIDNGGATRLDEYSPWNNPEYGGGDGAAYIDFVGNTLKPYIDANYRTLPQPQFNALIGSSMGALISTYGALAHADKFQKVGSMSPAYWFALTDLSGYINGGSFDLSNHRMYFVAGTNESATMVSHCNQVVANLQAKGMTSANTFTLYDPAGTHSENFWRAKFGALYQWLFAEEQLGKQMPDAEEPQIIQSASGEIMACRLQSPIDFLIIDVSGKTVGKISIDNGVTSLPKLAAGIYLLQSESLRIIKVFIRG